MLAIERVPTARYIKFMSVARGSSPRRDPRVKYESGSGEVCTLTCFWTWGEAESLAGTCARVRPG
jgi:hypothetical protein